MNAALTQKPVAYWLVWRLGRKLTVGGFDVYIVCGQTKECIIIISILSRNLSVCVRANRLAYHLLSNFILLQFAFLFCE